MFVDCEEILFHYLFLITLLEVGDGCDVLHAKSNLKKVFACHLERISSLATSHSKIALAIELQSTLPHKLIPHWYFRAVSLCRISNIRRVQWSIRFFFTAVFPLCGLFFFFFVNRRSGCCCCCLNIFKFNFTTDLRGRTIRNANATNCIIHKTNDNNIFPKGFEMKIFVRIITARSLCSETR